MLLAACCSLVFDLWEETLLDLVSACLQSLGHDLGT